MPIWNQPQWVQGLEQWVLAIFNLAMLGIFVIENTVRLLASARRIMRDSWKESKGQ